MKKKDNRLDKYVLEKHPDLSRTHIQRLIEEGSILVNNTIVKSGYKLREKDIISISIPELKKINILPEKIKLDILYEDKDLIVINKPQGMVTHPGSGIESGTLVNALLEHCKDSLSGINGVMRPGIVHRLDKDTSGLIIVCKNDKAHIGMAKQFHDRNMKKYYLALVHGKIKYTQGKINKPIARDKTRRHMMTTGEHDGKEAVTNFKLIRFINNFSLLECQIETGRTHQIRVHLSSIGYPIVGDKTYGKKNDNMPMMLHAYRIIFSHPITKKEMKLETAFPSRFAVIN